MRARAEGKERGALARAWRALAGTVTAALLTLVALNLVAAWLAPERPRRGRANPAFAHAFELAYPRLDEADRALLQEESGHGFVPELIAQPRERPMAGRFVHVEEAGFRRGRDQALWPPEPDAFTIFVLGGSTAFGYGVRDEDTVPSYLQAILARRLRGRRVAVYNFARGGFYSTQERILFTRLLALGPRPRLAVFVDGLNEFTLRAEPPTFTEYETRAASWQLSHPILAALGRLPIYRLLRRVGLGQRGPGDFAETFRSRGGRKPRRKPLPDDLARDLVDRYLANRAVIRALADAYGVSVAFVWQPIPVYRYDLRFHPAWTGLIGELHRNGYARMRSELEAAPGDPDFLWCADIQEGREEPLYVDNVHYNPRLSELLAECIAEGLERSHLLAAADARPGSPFSRLSRRAAAPE